MKRIRLLSVLGASALVTVALVATGPQQSAQATISWPIDLGTDFNAVQVNAHAADDVTVVGCGYGDQSVDLTESATTYNAVDASSMGCTTAQAADGTIYSLYIDSSGVRYIAASKDGLIEWKTATDRSNTCSGTYQIQVRSLALASNGNVVALLSGPYLNDGCGTYVAEYGAYSGTQVSVHSLGNPTSTSPEPQAWTYDDKIVAVDASGMEHVYDNAGTEDTGAQYQFSPNYYSSFYANGDGRVFMVKSCGSPGVAYHDLNGDSGSMTPPDCGSYTYVPGHDGHLVMYNGNGSLFYDLDPTATPPSSTGYGLPSLPSAPYGNYYTGQVTYLAQDTSGNFALVVQAHAMYTNFNAVFVYYISSGGTPSLVYTDSGSSYGAPTSANRTPAIYSGELYQPIVDSYNTSTAASDVYLHKIDIGTSGFGTMVPQGPGYATPSNQYVAMGDSYSSGEGNDPFLPDSAIDGTDECHRSATSYPVMLAGDDNLDLTNFLACSGATTDTLLNGGSSTGAWDEPAQVDALALTNPSMITLTIGGNDLGFSEVLNNCEDHVGHTGYGCSTDTTLQDTLNDRLAALAGTGTATIGGHTIHSLLSVYEAIHTAASGATIYVGGYPELFGSESANFGVTNESIPGGAACVGFPGVTFSYEDTEWINTEADALDDTIDAAVSAAQKEGIDIQYVPASFEGHALCDSGTSWLYGVQFGPDGLDVLPGSMHPSEDGQTFGYEASFHYAMS